MIITALYSKTHQDETTCEALVMNTRNNHLSSEKVERFINGGLAVCVSMDKYESANCRVLKVANSLIIGSIFPKGNWKIDEMQDLLKTEDIENFVIENCYGSYLIFSNKNDSLKITRDPIGQLPLFYSKLNERIFFSNEISVLADLTDKKLKYNWSYLSSFLLHTFITSDSTAFEGINELPHGCFLLVNSGSNSVSSSVGVAWDPRKFCIHNKNFISYEPLNIVENLIKIVRKTINCPNSRLMLDFSGGLDSSSLLLVLEKITSDPKLIYALNMFHPKVASSDEREIARALSNKVGSNFIEFDHSLHLPMSPTTSTNLKPNWPTSNLNHLKIEYDIQNIAQKLNIEKFISGHGGDHIFLCPPPIESVYDYFYVEGFKGIANHIRQVSSMGRIPMAKIFSTNLIAAIRHLTGIKYRRNSVFIDNVPWISDDAIQKAKDISFHPFFELDMSEILPGKFAQLENIFTGLSTIKSSLRGTSAPIVYPFFSQPMIELSLKIPTFRSYHNGYNRYPLRKSMQRVFGPSPNLWRKDKGETTGVTQIGIKENREYVLDLCLNGQAVSNGLIDKKYKDTLHRAIKDMMGGKPDYLWPINSLVALEIFLELWK